MESPASPAMLFAIGPKLSRRSSGRMQSQPNPRLHGSCDVLTTFAFRHVGFGEPGAEAVDIDFLAIGSAGEGAALEGNVRIRSHFGDVVGGVPLRPPSLLPCVVLHFRGICVNEVVDRWFRDTVPVGELVAELVVQLLQVGTPSYSMSIPVLKLE